MRTQMTCLCRFAIFIIQASTKNVLIFDFHQNNQFARSLHFPSPSHFYRTNNQIMLLFLQPIFVTVLLLSVLRSLDFAFARCCLLGCECWRCLNWSNRASSIDVNDLSDLKSQNEHQLDDVIENKFFFFFVGLFAYKANFIICKALKGEPIN